MVDTDVFSFVTWERDRYKDFEPFLRNRVLLLSFATVGELRAGAIKAGWGTKRINRLETIITTQYVVVPWTDAVTRRYAELHAKYHGHLKGGGVNDMWTAASALALSPSPPIVTNSLSDFATMAADFPIVIVHPDL